MAFKAFDLVSFFPEMTESSSPELVLRVARTETATILVYSDLAVLISKNFIFPTIFVLVFYVREQPLRTEIEGRLQTVMRPDLRV